MKDKLKISFLKYLRKLSGLMMAMLLACATPAVADATNKMRVEDNFYITRLNTNGEIYQGSGEASGIVAPVIYHSCESNSLPEVQNVEAHASPESTFLNYAAQTPDGWTGGDSTYSVSLPDGRRLWLFSDTFLGPLNADGTRPLSAPLVNNTFVAQSGDSMTTIRGGTVTTPAAIMPPPKPRFWYWLGDGMIADVDGIDHLQVIFHEWHKFDDGDWDFRINSTVVATFSLSDLTTPIRIDPIRAAAGVQWGSALLPAAKSGDGYTYIYGVKDAPTNKKMRIARVEGSDLSKVDEWEYLNNEQQAWMRGADEGTDITNGVANEYSVTPWNGDFVLVSQDSTEALSAKIRVWSACDPYGPFGVWVNNDVVYYTPEGGPWGSYGDPNIFTYNAHVHSTLTKGDRYTLSYNVNTFDNRVSPEGAHYRDPSIYKPRFVSFRLVPSSTATRFSPEFKVQ